MTLEEAMAALEAVGDAKMRALRTRVAAGDNQFGVKTSDLRALAAKIKSDPALAAKLWATGNLDAQLLATLLMKPKLLSKDELDQMVRSVTVAQVADWLMTSVVRAHPDKETLRQEWMASEVVMASRAGWSLTTQRVIKSPDGLDVPALLDRLEREMGSAPEMVQWTMNYCLAEIGINFPQHRSRAVAIGEKLGVFRDYPVSKGCVSPFAPIWITEMVKRNG